MPNGIDNRTRGIMEAAVKAVHTVDECVKKVTDKILAMGGSALVTADHGNADQMIADDGVMAFTQHTTNPVPVILVSEEYKNVTLREDGVLAGYLKMCNIPFASPDLFADGIISR